MRTSLFLHTPAHSRRKLWGRLQNIASHGISYIKHLTDPPGHVPGCLFPDTSALSELCQLFPQSEAVGLSLKSLRSWVLATQELLFPWITTELSRPVWDLTTPLTSLEGTGNSASKWSLACNWLPQIFRQRRKASLLLQPTVQSHLEETGNHTSITTVATFSSYSVSYPVLTTSDKTSLLYDSKNKTQTALAFLNSFPPNDSLILFAPFKSQRDFSWAGRMQKS